MRRLVVLGLMVLPLLVVGCSKGPAEAALKAGDEAIAKVAPLAEKLVPEQFKTLTDAAAAAKASFDKGDYAAALAVAKDLPAKADEVMAAASAKKDELTGLWKGLADGLPAQVSALTEKITAIGAMKKLPKGIDVKGFDAAKTGLAEVTGLWAKASEAFGVGNLQAALQAGNDVKAKADALAKSVEGVVLPPAPKK
jgi:hypothetical protein